MKFYLVGMFFLLFTGCVTQPKVALSLTESTCNTTAKHVVPYSLEFLSQEYECSKHEKVNG